MRILQGFRSIFLYPLLALIWFYQKGISPMLPQSCIYYPTCSEYAKRALIKHGILWGIFLASKRILKCNPFFQATIDSVPESPTLFKKVSKE